MITTFFDHIEIGYAIEPKAESARLIKQVHGPKIVEFTTEIPEADGVYTHKEDLPIHIFTADCIPLLFFSEDKSAPVVAVHSGWRGVQARIAVNALKLFKNVPVHVSIGPSILSCCFEVRQDLIDAFEANHHEIRPYLTNQNEQIFFNLVDYVIKTQLKGTTIHREWNRCTVCSSPSLPSYRRNKSTDPHIRSWIKKRSGE